MRSFVRPLVLARPVLLAAGVSLCAPSLAQDRTRLTAPEQPQPASEPGSSGAIPGWAETIRGAYQEAQRHGTVALTTRLSGPVAAGRSEVWVELTVSALAYPGGDVQPVNAALVMDQSASMRGTGLRAEKAAALELVDHLGELDRLSIIRTSTGVQTLESLRCTEANKKKMREFIDKMEASGNSDISIGFDNAVEQLHPYLDQYPANHILLVSDGRLTHGMNDPAGLAQLAKDTREQMKIHVSALAVGEEADQELMSGIAKEGWGLYGYVSDAARSAALGRRLRLEFLRRAAEKIELGFKPAPDVAVEDVLGFDEFRDPDAIRIPLYELGPGETLTVRLRLSVSSKEPAAKRTLGTLELDYHDGLVDTERTTARELTVAVEKTARSAQPEQDGALIARGLSALAERNLVWAEGAADEADLPQALKLVDSTRAKLIAAKAIVPDGSLSAALDRLDKARDRFASPNHAFKHAKKKAKNGKRG